MSFRDSATAEQINFGGHTPYKRGPVVMVRWNRKKLNVYRVKVKKENGSHADARRVIRSISTYVLRTEWKYLQVPFVRHDDPTLNPTGKRQLTNYNVVVVVVVVEARLTSAHQREPLESWKPHAR
jgi:hypothetical protein